MIKYLSTRDNTHTITSSQAIINGLAEDGGLYIPENLEDLKLDYHEVIQQDYPGMAETVFGKFFSDFDEETIEKVVSRSYTGKFSTEEITPLAKVEDAVSRSDLRVQGCGAFRTSESDGGIHENE